jgi:hypothetical protein
MACDIYVFFGFLVFPIILYLSELIFGLIRQFLLLIIKKILLGFLEHLNTTLKYKICALSSVLSRPILPFVV